MTKNPENKGEADLAAGEVTLLADRGKRVRSDAEQQRRERAAAKLRENLARRKQQSRARRAGEAEDGVGLPAANSAPRPPEQAGDEASDETIVALSAANSSKPGD